MQSANRPQSQHEPAPSRSSILGLDALTFLMADVRDGVGPYLFECFNDSYISTNRAGVTY